MVTGIGDFSPHRQRRSDDGHHRRGRLSRARPAEAAQDSAWLEAVAVQRHGPDTAHWIDVYRRFYGFYFSNSHVRPALYGWCLRQLGQ
jgi:putative membrane protein